MLKNCIDIGLKVLELSRAIPENYSLGLLRVCGHAVTRGLASLSEANWQKAIDIYVDLLEDRAVTKAVTGLAADVETPLLLYSLFFDCKNVSVKEYLEEKGRRFARVYKTDLLDQKIVFYLSERGLPLIGKIVRAQEFHEEDREGTAYIVQWKKNFFDAPDCIFDLPQIYASEDYVKQLLNKDM